MKMSADKHIYICGHSLGAAMAVIAASRLSSMGRAVTLYTDHHVWAIVHGQNSLTILILTDL